MLLYVSLIVNLALIVFIFSDYLILYKKHKNNKQSDFKIDVQEAALKAYTKKLSDIETNLRKNIRSASERGEFEVTYVIGIADREHEFYSKVFRKLRDEGFVITERYSTFKISWEVTLDKLQDLERVLTLPERDGKLGQ